MKRILALITVLLLCSAVLLAACESGGTESTAEPAEGRASSEPSVGEDGESKEESKEESKDESSKAATNEIAKLPTEYAEGSMNIEAASFSEKPYFALVGRCAEGAVVTGEADGETVTSKSYKGWYSLRLKCSGKTVDVKLSQTVDGAQVGETLEYTVKPVTPGSEMWPTVTGGDFQFFFQKMLPDFQGTNIPAKYQYDNLTVRTQNKIKQLQEINPDAEIIYMIVPSSMTVYPELVPEEYAPATEKTKLDLTVDALNAAGATVIDLKTVFAEHKNDEMPLYYKLDSHWSDYGAYVAYEALFEHISKKFPEAAPRGTDEFNWAGDYYQSGDMTYYLAMSQSRIKEYAYYRTFNVSVSSSVTSANRYVSSEKLTYSDAMTYEKRISTGNDKLPDCIVMRDSYSTQIYDILAERMNNTHYLGMWNYTWDINTIKNDSPDYIIYILAEWNLDSVIYG